MCHPLLVAAAETGNLVLQGCIAACNSLIGFEMKGGLWHAVALPWLRGC